MKRPREDDARLARERFLDAARVMRELAETHAGFVAAAAEAIETCFRAGGRLFTCGNGGSAADAQHIAAELSGRFYIDRPGLAAISLTVNTSALTAIGNDYDFSEVYSRQLDGVAAKGDVLLAITTSGGSANVVKAVEKARGLGMVVIGFTGARGERFAAACDHALVVPSTDTPRIQEGHIAAGHLICQLVETAMFGDTL